MVLDRHHSIALPRRAMLAFMLLVALLAAACSGSGGKEDDGKVTIRYARWGIPEELEAERELLKDFEAANPDVRVVVEFAAWSEYWNKLQAQMAAGTAPDVFLVSGERIHDYVPRNQIENLQPWVAKDAGFDPSLYFKPTIDVFTFRDGFWAMPRDCNTIGIFYNKTLFEKQGVPLPKPGWTWDDFLAAARALTIDENGDGRMETYGYLAAFESIEVHWVSWIWQNGGTTLDEARTKSRLAEPEAVEAIRFLSDLVLKEKVSPDTAQASTFGSNMFLTGRLAMSPEGSWMFRLFNDIEGFEWDVAPLPRGKFDTAPVNGLGNAIYSGSKNKDAAWRLCRFLSSETYQRNLAKSGTSIPALKSLASSPEYLDGNPPGKELLLAQIERGRTMDFTPGFSRCESAVRGELELVWLGRKSVEDAMKDAAAKVDGILAAGAAGEN